MTPKLILQDILANPFNQSQLPPPTGPGRPLNKNVSSMIALLETPGCHKSDRQNINSLSYQAVLLTALLRNLLETCGTPGTLRTFSFQNSLPCWVLQLLKNLQPSLPKTFISGTFTSKTPWCYHVLGCFGANPNLFWQASKPPFRRNIHSPVA